MSDEDVALTSRFQLSPISSDDATPSRQWALQVIGLDGWIDVATLKLKKRKNLSWSVKWRPTKQGTLDLLGFRRSAGFKARRIEVKVTRYGSGSLNKVRMRKTTLLPTMIGLSHDLHAVGNAIADTAKPLGETKDNDAATAIVRDRSWVRNFGYEAAALLLDGYRDMFQYGDFAAERRLRELSPEE